MSAFTSLRLGDLEALIPVFGEHGVAEGLGAVGVGSFADRQVGHCLIEGLVLIEARETRFVDPGWAARVFRRDPGCQLGDVLRGRSAASADQTSAILAYELKLGRGELVWLQRVVRTFGGQNRQTGVRHDHQRQLRVFREVAKVLAHFGRSGGTVETDRIDAKSR